MKQIDKDKVSKLLVSALKTVTVCAVAYIILYMVDHSKYGKK